MGPLLKDGTEILLRTARLVVLVGDPLSSSRLWTGRILSIKSSALSAQWSPHRQRHKKNQFQARLTERQSFLRA
jgi:hypothetical protein